jgi:uncharacterized protein (UPF0335 family)
MADGSPPVGVADLLERPVGYADRHAIPAGEADVPTSPASGRLRSLLERVERLRADREAVNADMAEVFAEAKGEGFDIAVMRKVIALRALDPAKRAETEALVDLYLAAVGEL